MSNIFVIIIYKWYYNSEIFYLHQSILVARYIVQRRKRINVAETINAKRFITFHFLWLMRLKSRILECLSTIEESWKKKNKKIKTSEKERGKTGSSGGRLTEFDGRILFVWQLWLFNPAFDHEEITLENIIRSYLYASRNRKCGRSRFIDRFIF